jgi:hypothetical protein
MTDPVPSSLSTNQQITPEPKKGWFSSACSLTYSLGSKTLAGASWALSKGKDLTQACINNTTVRQVASTIATTAKQVVSESANIACQVGSTALYAGGENYRTSCKYPCSPSYCR